MAEKQKGLFDDFDNKWQEEWKDMPEFIQEDLTSHRKIIVHFRNDDDVKIFSELLEQRITPKQISLWFPKLEIRSTKNKIYIDES